MSDIINDVGKIWDRLFDHRAVISGEVTFLLGEFEQKRGDQEVDKLFHVIENLAEIKDTGIYRFKQVIEDSLYKANQDLRFALDVCSKFKGLEEKYIQDTTIEERRTQRKPIWDKFMDDIEDKYSDINTEYQKKEQALESHYRDIEKQLLI